MVITYYDVSLKWIREEDIELVRYWRNHDKIKNKMEFREPINVEQQRAWFKTMKDYTKNFAFIIQSGVNSIGLVYHSISADASEGGMFIWDDAYIDSGFPVVLSTLLTDINFYFLKNEFSYIKILRDNFKVITYNQNFGYKLMEGEENNFNQKYSLTKDDYELKVKRVRRTLELIYGIADKPLIVIEKHDREVGFFDYYHDLIHHHIDSPKLFRMRLEF